MKKNWKTSFGKCIYRSNDELKIFDNYIYRWLTFSSPYIQTLICKLKLHKPELQYIKPLTLAARNEKGKTCLLGLGGGGLIHYLNNLNIELTIIENNELVISVAQKYFMLDKIPNLNIKNIDANKFVKNQKEKYLNLLIDIHDAYTFPKQCLNLDFFISCKKILQENGVLAINICNKSDLQIIYNFLSSLFNNKVIRIPINGYTNTILLASDKYSINNIIDTFANHHEVKKLEWDSKFGYIVRVC